MSLLSDGLDEALTRQAREGGEFVKLGDGAAEAEARVVDSDRIGVRVSRVRVHKGAAVDVAKEAAALPERLRALPERLVPLEIDAAHGSAVLRTATDEMRRREFFEVQVAGGQDLDVRRYRVDEAGQRQGIDWTMTREQLGRLMDELAAESE